MPQLSQNDLNVVITTEAETAGVSRAEASLGEFRASAERLSSTMGGASRKTNVTGNQIEETGVKSAKAAPKINNYRTQVEGFGQTAKLFFGYLGAIAAVRFTTEAISSSFASASRMEQANKQFESLIPNIKQAHELYGSLVNYTYNTPFQFKQLQAATQQLLAFGADAGDIKNLISNIGNVAAVSNGNLQQLAHVSGEILSEGRFNARNLNELIRDGGAGIVQVMAKDAGGMHKLRNAMQKGDESSKAFLKALREANQKGGFAFQGAQKQANTMAGRLSNLKDIALKLGDAFLGVKVDKQKGLQIDPNGLFAKIEKAMTKLTNTLSVLSNHTKAIKTTFSWLAPVAGGILAVAAAIGVARLATMLWNATIALNPWTAIITGIVVAILVLVTHWQQVVSFFTWGWHIIKGGAMDFWHWIKAHWPLLLTILTGPIGLAATFIIRHWQAILRWARFIINSIATFFARLPGRIWASLKQLYAIIKWPFAHAYTWVRDMVRNILSWFSNLPGQIGHAMGGVAYQLERPFQKAWKFIKRIARDIRNTVGNIASEAKRLPAQIGHGTAHYLNPLNWFASGTSHAPGGLTMVGERGPELMRVPRGSQIYTNAQSQSREKSPGSDIYIEFHGDVYMRDQSEAKNVGLILARQLQAARAGAF